ncbi:UDP-N-acetylglucosamine1-carboxyvinyltransferase [Stanieria cyanosphaera PCC 7437]|uniref:UDP-N-acetylglucosamine 1-carboxyvinyltransferase n=1 Tax=Stanieria cyanosphaera (strain ATCC 29371 / PCC 7437) TaxID=111780 RepID=K9Y1N9_STAC7|nr:UDP-N-acetylglucosamine1-carboxyvinyltransferase [Stanieria cyanosphaera PCC 7437]
MSLEDKAINLSLKLTQTPLVSAEDQPRLKIVGKASLQGEVKISGAKNSALVLMAGSLLCEGDSQLHNVPDLVDIKRMSELLKALGVKIVKKDNIFEINATDIDPTKAPYDIVSQLRASFFIIGPLLSRFGVVRIPLPGGCAIGARPVDLHVRGLQAMGANVRIESGIVHANVVGRNRRLQGANIFLDYPSVGATETIMMAATLAEGETKIENAAQEPEVVDLANFCCQMGAKISGAGTNTIIISGVKNLYPVKYSVIPDRIEAGTFLVAGAITRSEISLYPVIAEHLAPVIAKLQDIGCQVIAEEAERLRIIPGQLKATDLETLPYPGFPTDMQAQFMALLSISEGNSVVSETVFENRLRHVAELSRMGADIRVKSNHALIRGVPFLSGAPVMASDLRASAALVLAGLAAEGTTIVSGLHHLDRGYDNIEGKLRQLGATLERINPT